MTCSYLVEYFTCVIVACMCDVHVHTCIAMCSLADARSLFYRQITSSLGRHSSSTLLGVSQELSAPPPWARTPHFFDRKWWVRQVLTSQERNEGGKEVTFPEYAYLGGG